VTPTFDFSVNRDSNRDLVPDGTPTNGASMSLDLQLKYATERFNLSVHPQVALQRFSNSEYANSNDYGLAGAANWLTERSKWGLTGQVSEQNLSTTEFSTTGLVEPGTRMRTENAGGSWTYSQTETRSLTLLANYLDTTYLSVTDAPTPLHGYEGETLAATEQFQHSDRLSWLVTASGSAYTQEGIASSTHSYGLVAGFKSQLSERTTLSADGGASRTTFESLTSTGFLYDLSLSRATETGSLSLTASRSISPVGYGEITQQDTLRFSAQRNLSERLSGDAAASVYRYSGVFDVPGFGDIDLTNLDRTYAQISTGLNWLATETWSLSGHVIGTRLEGKEVPSAQGWQIRLDAVWTPRGRSVSR
jgi:hypothetical protein